MSGYHSESIVVSESRNIVVATNDGLSDLSRFFLHFGPMTTSLSEKEARRLIDALRDGLTKAQS